MARKHTQALVTRIKTVSAFASKTWSSVVPDGTVKPYCVVHPAQGTNTQERLTAPSTTKHPRFTLHVVGETADQVQLLMDLLEAAVFPNGKGAVTVANESVKNFWYASPLPIQVLTDPLPEVIYGVVECGWTADPS